MAITSSTTALIMSSPVNWRHLFLFSLIFWSISSQIVSMWILLMLNGFTLSSGFTLTTKKPINSNHDSRHLPRGWFGAIPDDDASNHNNDDNDEVALVVENVDPSEEAKKDEKDHFFHDNQTPSSVPSDKSNIDGQSSDVSVDFSHSFSPTNPSIDSHFSTSLPTSSTKQTFSFENSSDDWVTTDLVYNNSDENENEVDQQNKVNEEDGFMIRGSSETQEEATAFDKHFCACKNETTHSWDHVEISCKCFGETIVDIPNHLTKGVAKLSMISTGIQTLVQNAFHSYSASLKDLYLESVKKLRWIEPGAFNNLPFLRTVYIKQAPLLKFIHDGVFFGSFPKFQVLKIIQSGLEVLPSMKYFETKGIISLLDFDSNRLKNISSASIRVRASNMILDYNSIEKVYSYAFLGSHIAKLSLKGNRRLVTIDDEAFVGLRNLAKLDLSETSITRLPTKGLEEVEVIKIVDTFTLKVFPSVFNFKNLKEAQLTYPYHCCAFKFPATHDPKEFASRVFEERRNCRQGTSGSTVLSTPSSTTTVATTSTTLLTSLHSLNLINNYELKSNGDLIGSYWKFIGDGIKHYTRRLNSLLSDNNFIGSINSQKSIESSSLLFSDNIISEDEQDENEDNNNENNEKDKIDDDNGARDKMRREMKNHLDDSVRFNSSSIINSNSLPNGEYITTTLSPLMDQSIFGKLIVSPSDAIDQKVNSSSIDILAGALNPQSPGFGQVQPSIFELPNEQLKHSEGDFIGQFHPTAASVLPEKPIHAFCGEYAQIFRDIKCSPEPDAFNPCEDVMGNLMLRIADWIISIAAVLGNLAVMVVLMSGRFKMNVSKFLMCNLAFADFCMGIYLLIIAIIDIHTVGVYFNYAIDWQHGLGCMITGFITVFASELSIITLTVITLERWYAITHAIHLHRRLKLNLAVKTMIGGWIYSLLMASLPLFGISGYSKTSICLPMENKDTVDIIYLITLLSFNALAFLLITACYGKMYHAVASQHGRITANDQTIAKRMALLALTDFACWAPIAFFGLTAVAGYPLINLTNSKILLVFFYPLNSCANPFLYAILTKQYRRDFFILISRYGLCRGSAARYKGTSNNCKHRRKGSCKKGRFCQVAYDCRTDRHKCKRCRHCLHSNTSSEENSSRSVIYSAIELYPDSSVSGDSVHEVLKMGHVICDDKQQSCSHHHHHYHHHYHHHKSNKESKKFPNHRPISQTTIIYSDDESNSSISLKKSPLIIKNGKELRRLPSSERDEVLRKMLGDSTLAPTTAGKNVVPSVWTTSNSCTSIHKSHKNCTSWIQRDSSSGEKSSAGNNNSSSNGTAIEIIKREKRCYCCKHCKRIPIENGSFVLSSHSNSAADDTEI
ncbi:leucine-rich repeat-containing G-protein coupled receptor 4-like isoform X2 [Tetranychus urticae]|nr:leucine-rich repeat-containing G-protein coupled receptor 4-like isoform X2 [Tetranychus urticae]